MHNALPCPSLARFVPVLLATMASSASAQNQLWLKQFGSNENENGRVASADGAGGAFVCTQPHLTNHPLPKLTRLDGSGAVIWAKSFGQAALASASGAQADGQGGVLVCGFAFGEFYGPSSGDDDVWVARFSSSGSELAAAQFGTASMDVCWQSAPDGVGGLVLVGFTRGDFGALNAGGADAWVARVSANCAPVWIRQFGSSGYDSATSITADGAGGFFIGGITDSDLISASSGGMDAWVAHVDAAGQVALLRQFGTPAEDTLTALASDGGGGLFAGGNTLGDLGGPSLGQQDVWLARLDASGAPVQMTQVGSDGWEALGGLARTNAAGLLAALSTTGGLNGPNQGAMDVALIQLNASGQRISSIQFGSTQHDSVEFATTDGSGGFLVGGSTNGSLGPTSFGGLDAWIARFDGSCSTSFHYCSASVSSGGCQATVLSSGTASTSSPQDFLLYSGQLEPHRNALMFFGSTGPQDLPFAGGSLCVHAPIYRLKAKNSGAGGPCSGSLQYTLLDLVQHPAGGSHVVPGAVLNLQLWYRDPPSSFGVGLSDGLQFAICP